MMLVKQDFLDQLKDTFWTQGVRQVDGTYDGVNGVITFHFLDGDVVSCPFEYDSVTAGLDSVSGFKELLFRTGGVIIQDYNTKFPHDNDRFTAAVTEPNNTP
jgi:hypothetical protein